MTSKRNETSVFSFALTHCFSLVFFSASSFFPISVVIICDSYLPGNLVERRTFVFSSRYFLFMKVSGCDSNMFPFLAITAVFASAKSQVFWKVMYDCYACSFHSHICIQEICRCHFILSWIEASGYVRT